MRLLVYDEEHTTQVITKECILPTLNVMYTTVVTGGEEIQVVEEFDGMFYVWLSDMDRRFSASIPKDLIELYSPTEEMDALWDNQMEEQHESSTWG